MIKRIIIAITLAAMCFMLVACNSSGAPVFYDTGGIQVTYRIKDDKQPATQEVETMVEALKSRLEKLRVNSKNIIIAIKEPLEAGSSTEISVTFEAPSDGTDPLQMVVALGERGYLSFRDPEGNIVLDGSNVKTAKVQRNETEGTYEVALKFDEAGTEKFAAATSALVGKEMGIYLDDELLLDPTVVSPIMDGTAIITGGTSGNMDGSKESAERLADIILSGALPFELELLSLHEVRFY